MQDKNARLQKMKTTRNHKLEDYFPKSINTKSKNYQGQCYNDWTANPNKQNDKKNIEIYDNKTVKQAPVGGE